MYRVVRYLPLVLVWLLAASTRADVRVFAEDAGGRVFIRYECTAGEVVRAFALDVSVDQGVILSVSDFFVGESNMGAQGYGIFPASIRDHLSLGPDDLFDFTEPAYTPVANSGDGSGAQAGLNTAAVTLELGGLWDPDVAAAVPGSTGTLCSLEISEAANVTVAANTGRGGVLSVSPGELFTPVFSGAFVDPNPAITSVNLTNGILTIHFTGGELEWAPALDGTWTGTGDVSGDYSEAVGQPARFYRVRRP